jgi:hypothetical protein
MPLIEITPRARRLLLEELRRSPKPDAHAILLVDEPVEIQHSLSRPSAWVNRSGLGRVVLMALIAVRSLLSPHKRQLRPYAFPIEKAVPNRLVEMHGIRLQFFEELYSQSGARLILDVGKGSLVIRDESGQVLAPRTSSQH